MTQSVVLQIGQCGNQVGRQFWERALKEHAEYNEDGTFDESLNTFFRNVDTRFTPARDLPLKRGAQIASLRARAVLIDMEEGVVNEVLSGPLADVFDTHQTVTNVSGSGNNWAVGYFTYGQTHKEQISDTVRIAVEQCDCLQSFILLHSMGGGTGSGLGTYVLELLHDEYPSVYRFVTAVYPSKDDDVITSPYNSVLAMHQLQQHADCVIPVENQALQDIVEVVDHQTKGRLKRNSAVTGPDTKKSKPWDRMNSIVANTLLNMTSSSRFAGSLNVDVNEITTNLVPFPGMHFLTCSLSPLYDLADVRVPPRRLDQMFSDAFDPSFQLAKCHPRKGILTACALMVRGNVEVSDIRRNIDRVKSKLHFVKWNQEGWKTGLCAQPPVGQRHALLCMANNTCLHETFSNVRSRFLQLYRKRAFRHHYTTHGMDEDRFTAALASLDHLLSLYSDVEATSDSEPQQLPDIDVL
ncbi:tubulin [Salpingoeca rosetta]|uniref:Tubulin n=1 Tax=Salpingoeca rosetta (strain ATCC 50818 / BSB-021) TaxID=946362 RepID=F2U7X9_SALR5|nr:tubulin [Salpingoeca rosetta]EGD72884.1 tubulin [Salpingoeca rosetta]|eukprot:XP_004994706.1 tubulin [Salpingoeca rosetta]